MANTNVVPKACQKCGRVTKGIWIRKGKMMCWKCYCKTTHRMPNLKDILKKD